MTSTFKQLDNLAREGITLTVAGEEEAEHFDVFVLYIADFSHMKVFGRAQVNAEQGCPARDRPASTWHKSQEMRGNHKIACLLPA